MDQPTASAYIATTPASLLREVSVTGTPNEVVDQVAEWRDHGLRYLVVANASILHRRLGKALQSTGPLVKILRSRRKF